MHITNEVRNRSEPKQYISLARDLMRKIVRWVCPEQHRSAAALDGVSQTHGTDNFLILNKKLTVLVTHLPEFKATVSALQMQLKKAETALGTKSYFRSPEHFLSVSNPNGPSVHCHHLAFGIVDPTAEICEDCETVRSPCGHYHTGECIACSPILEFRIEFENLLNDIEKICRLNWRHTTAPLEKIIMRIVLIIIVMLIIIAPLAILK